MPNVPTNPRALKIPYNSWRTNQAQVVQDILDSKAKVVFVSASTGTGKSAIAIATAKLSGPRSVIVTHTRQLQKQYISEFRGMDLMRLIGRENYRCLIQKRLNVADAPCNAGWKCPKFFVCDYFA